MAKHGSAKSVAICYNVVFTLLLVIRCFLLRFSITILLCFGLVHGMAQPISKGVRNGQQAAQLCIYKGMLLPGLFANNVSVGYEQQLGPYTSWMMLFGGSAGLYQGMMESYARMTGRFGHRWYARNLQAVETGVRANAYFELGTGWSTHRRSGGSAEALVDAYQSGFASLAFGQQLFARKFTIDTGLGVRGHVGRRNHGRLGSLVGAWTADAWPSVLLHVQVGFGMGAGKKVR